MNRTPGGPTPPDVELRINSLVRGLPDHSEIADLLANLDDPASDEASRDRHVGIVAANVVEGALRLVLDAKDPDPPPRNGFKVRINRASKLGLVTAAEAEELHRIRNIRDIFAHALVPIGFDDPTIEEVTALFWNHPISSWSGYFLPTFPARHRFAIVCREYVKRLSP